MKLRFIPAVLLIGCAAPITYSYDTDIPVVMVNGERDEETRFVSSEKEPIPPVKYDHWFIRSGWAVALGDHWADLPYVFDANGPEYCTALGVDRNRMLHASGVVRYRDNNLAAVRCPTLVWKDGEFMIGLSPDSHSHQTLNFHGERISRDDAGLGSPVLASVAGKAKIEMSRVAVRFFSGERLIGIDPSTGKEAPVPAQSLLFTRVNGKTRVFLWTPLAIEKEGKTNFVQVYRPAPNDEWEKAGVCWVDLKEIQQSLPDSVPPTHCDPDDFWLK